MSGISSSILGFKSEDGAITLTNDKQDSRSVNLQFCYESNRITHFKIVKDSKDKKYDIYQSNIGWWSQIPLYHNGTDDFLNQANFASHTTDNLLNRMIGTYKCGLYNPQLDYLDVDSIIPQNEWVDMVINNPYYVVEIIDDTLYPPNTNNAVCGIKVKKSFATCNLATTYSNELKCQAIPFRVEICKVNEWIPVNKNKSIFDKLVNLFSV